MRTQEMPMRVPQSVVAWAEGLCPCHRMICSRTMAAWRPHAEASREPCTSLRLRLAWSRKAGG